MGECLDATGAILFFAFVFVVLAGGIGVYFLYTAGLLDGYLDWTRMRWANYNAEREEQKRARAALAEASRREQHYGIETPLAPEALLDGVAEGMIRKGWGIQSRSGNTVTFSRDEGADGCLGCFLMLFLIVPGILYLLLYNTTKRVTASAHPHPGGSRLILGGDDFVVMRQITEWARTLRPGDTVVGANAVPALSAADSQSALPQRSASERLRELAELRDAGLITPEEYEEKKRRLLEEL
jgi:hypothetical protein